MVCVSCVRQGPRPVELDAQPLEQGKGFAVVRRRLGVMPEMAMRVSEAIERRRFHMQVTGLALKGECLLAVADRLGMTAGQCEVPADCVERVRVHYRAI